MGLRQFFTQEGAEQATLKASSPYSHDASLRLPGEMIGLRITESEETLQKDTFGIALENESGEIHG